MIVSATHVSRVFVMPAGPVAAVRDVSLDVAAGDHIAVRGPSGCGKSTLLHMLGCVDTPTEGTLLFEGHDVARLSDRERSLLRLRSIGFVFQRFFLLPMLSAAENVELPMSEAGVAAAERRQRTRELLDYVACRPARITVRRSSPAARCSAWRSPVRWPIARGCSLPTNPPGSWIRPPVITWRRCWIA
jgi:ABC-type lipoprotein export system ATPase subunit